MSIVESLTLKTASSTIGAVVAILGAFWAIDNHYASASDVGQLQRSLESQVRALRSERAEDELFKLDMKRQSQSGKLSPEDAALYQRYSRRLDQTEKEQTVTDSKPPQKNK